MKTALIIGISGQDGGYLAAHLLSKGYRVCGTSRDHEAGQFFNLKALGVREKVELLSMNASDFRSVYTAIQQVAPDEIYNLAGQSSVGLSFSQPVEAFESISVGTLQILECLRVLHSTARFYNAGSSEAFGNTSSPANEETPFKPRSPYAAAKAAAHYMVSNYRESYGLFACTGILFNHESPLRPKRFVTRKIVAAAAAIAQGTQDFLELGNIGICRDWGWAPEYVDAMWRILQHESPDDFVIATGQSHSLKDFVDRVFHEFSLDPSKYIKYNSAFDRPSDIDLSVGDPTKANEILNWSAKTMMPEVVRKLVAEQRGVKAL